MQRKSLLSGQLLPATRQEATTRTAGSDKPPYYIPFRIQKDAISTGREQFRLGDAMRLRQLTDDLIFDLPATLRATMDRGGYPEVRYRYRSRPTEYLFLIEEQVPGHHLARLFRHLAETLRGQDVTLNMVWHDSGLHRFWGGDLLKSVSINGLRRYFPHHRMVLLGTGHALLDEHSETPCLRPGIAAELNNWPQRLLLTPQPPDAWGWRESVLYRHFGLFPADLRGIHDAAGFVENGLDTTEMPRSFLEWKAKQLDSPPNTNPEYRGWRTLADHDKYLEPYYDETLGRWFRALAVHPTPTWEVTLAIARALGIEPTHDHLLVLARIPALREGRLHPGLRREMLKDLSKADEITARTAVLEELQAIHHLTEGSHVADETDTYLTIQDFLLDPEDKTKHTRLAVLLDAGALSRAQEIDLDVFVEKTLPPALFGEGETVPQEPPKIREWLAEWLSLEAKAQIKNIFLNIFLRVVDLFVLIGVIGVISFLIYLFHDNPDWLQLPTRESLTWAAIRAFIIKALSRFRI